MVADSQDQIFKSIHTANELKTLTESMANHQVEILCKLPQEKILKVQFSRIEKTEMLCRLFDPNLKISKVEVICSFVIAGEKHFFTSTLHAKSPQEISIQLPQKFFVLQRRQNYRLRLPDSYQAQLLITQPPQKSTLGRLIDLSVGGCRVNLDLVDLVYSLDQEVKGRIQIKGRDPIEFSGVVRHLQGQTLGIEFVPFSPALESRVFALTMDLHKELFSRLK